MPMLADLLIEVVTLLAIELEREDFLNFRLTCQELNSKSFSCNLPGQPTTHTHLLEKNPIFARQHYYFVLKWLALPLIQILLAS